MQVKRVDREGEKIHMMAWPRTGLTMVLANSWRANKVATKDLHPYYHSLV